MSWWKWMVSDSNQFVPIRREGRGSVGKQLVLRTGSSTYQFLVKAPSWLHWDLLLKWWGCTATRCSVIDGMEITSINETAGFIYCLMTYTIVRAGHKPMQPTGLHWATRLWWLHVSGDPAPCIWIVVHFCQLLLALKFSRNGWWNIIVSKQCYH